MALFVSVAGTLLGTEYSFTGNNANWNVAANWSDNVLPGAGDTGIIAGSPGSPRTAYFNANLAGPPDAIRIQPNGRLRLNASMTTEHNLIMEGGEICAFANYYPSSTIFMRSDSYFWRTGSDSMVLSGVVMDYGAEAGRLIVTNGAIMLSNNANSYSGGTRLAGGRAVATQNNSFGTGPVEVLPGGALHFHQHITLGNTIILDGGSLHATANYSLFSTNNLKSDSYLYTTAAEPTVKSLFKDFGPGQAGKLIKTGTGGCYVTNPNNSYSGGTRIEGGRLWLKINNTLGTGPVEVVTNGMLYFDAHLTLTNPVILNGGALGAGLNYSLTSTNWIRSRGEVWSTAATPQIRGPIRDEDPQRPGQLVKTGSGNFYITAATNTYSGGTLVKEGMLVCDASTFSPPSGEQCLGRGDVVVTNGATLRLTGMRHANHPDASIIILSNATVRFHSQSFNTCTTNVIVKAGGHLYSSGVYIIAYYTSFDSVRLEGCVNLHRYEGVRGGTGWNKWYGTFSDGAEPGQLAIVGTNSGLTELHGTYTYTGGTIIRDGGPEAAELTLAGAGNMPDTGTILIEQNGVMNFNNISDTVGGLAGAGLVKLGSGTVTCAEAISPGTNALFGCTLSVTGTTGRVVLGPQAVSTFHLRTPGDQDRVVLTGGATLTLGGELKVEKLGTLDEGAYTLFELADGAAPVGDFASVRTPNGYSGRVAVVGNDVVLTVARQGMIFTLR